MPKEAPMSITALRVVTVPRPFALLETLPCLHTTTCTTRTTTT